MADELAKAFGGSFNDHTLSDESIEYLLQRQPRPARNLLTPRCSEDVVYINPLFRLRHKVLQDNETETLSINPATFS